MSSALRNTLIHVAYKTQKPQLKRELVALLKQADYPPEFIDWMQAKGPIFENPSTGNKVKFLSLDSHTQAVAANQWKPKWEQTKEDTSDEGTGEGDESAGHKQFPKYQTSEHTYRGKGGDDTDKVNWRPGDLEMVLPEKIRAQYASIFENANYNTIKELLENIETALSDPESSPMYWESGYSEAGLKKLKKMLNDRLKDAEGRLYTDNAGQHGVTHEFGEVVMDNFYDWRKDKPATGRKLSWEQLKTKFIQEAHLDAGEATKVRGMSGEEFKHMYLHVLDADGIEEDEEIFEMAASTKTAQEEPPPPTPKDEAEDEEHIDEEEVDDSIEQKETDEDLISIFDKPRAASADKVASLAEIRELMIRSAYHTGDAETKRRLLRMLQAESQDPGDPSMDTEEEGEGEGYDPGEVLENEETGEGPPDESESELPGDDNDDDDGDVDEDEA